jgi:hypothetical protein
MTLDSQMAYELVRDHHRDLMKEAAAIREPKRAPASNDELKMPRRHATQFLFSRVWHPFNSLLTKIRQRTSTRQRVPSARWT